MYDQTGRRPNRPPIVVGSGRLLFPTAGVAGGARLVSCDAYSADGVEVEDEGESRRFSRFQNSDLSLPLALAWTWLFFRLTLPVNSSVPSPTATTRTNPVLLVRRG